MSDRAISIRRLTATDFGVADGILREAFGTPDSFKADLQRCMALQEDGWFFATHAGSPAGMVGAVDYGNFAYVGLMAVHPALQSRGIGRALMLRLLAWLDARGTPVALLDATEAGRPLYASLGFVEQDQACVFAQQAESQHSLSCLWHTGQSFGEEARAATPRSVTARGQPGGFGGTDRVRPVRLRDLPALVEFDTPIFGAAREAVFRALLTAEGSERFFLVHDGAGQLSGYLCAQSQRIGPWAARRPEDAEALIQVALSLPYAVVPRVLVPQANRAAAHLLERNGFHLVRAIRHMRRGGSRHPGRRELLYGQASFAIG
jgi:GNAT superfamily N-acetyltransferase